MTSGSDAAVAVVLNVTLRLVEMPVQISSEGMETEADVTVVDTTVYGLRYCCASHRLVPLRIDQLY